MSAQQPATAVLAAQRDDLKALARSLIVAGAVMHGSTEKVQLPFDPAALRLLGRAMEAMLAFEDHRKDVERGQAEAHSALIAAQAEAVKAMTKAGREFRKALAISVLSLVWAAMGFVAWVAA